MRRAHSNEPTRYTSITLTHSEFAALDAAAERCGVSRSQIIGMLTAYVDNLEPPYEPPAVESTPDGRPVPMPHGSHCKGPDIITVERLMWHGIADFAPDAYICLCEVRLAALKLHRGRQWSLAQTGSHLNVCPRSVSRWVA